MQSYPNLTFRASSNGRLSPISRIRPLWYLPYDKNAAKRLSPTATAGMVGGGHHLENRYTAFHHAYFAPRRLGQDL